MAAATLWLLQGRESAAVLAPAAWARTHWAYAINNGGSIEQDQPCAFPGHRSGAAAAEGQGQLRAAGRPSRKFGCYALLVDSTNIS